MKTIFKFTSIVALLFTAAVGMANEPYIKLDTQSGGQSLIFKPDSDSQGTQIKFVDADGHVIFSDIVGSAVSGKKFDLSHLEDGTYFFILEYRLKEMRYTVSIDGEKVLISDRMEKNRPVFRQKGNKVFLNLLNLDRNKVEIKVLDSDNRVLYKQVVDNSLLVKKAFNFEKAFEDTYTIVVKDNKDSYYENVEVK